MIAIKYIHKNDKGFSLADITKNIIQFRQKEDPYIFEGDKNNKFRIDFHYVDGFVYGGEGRFLYNYQIGRYKRKNDYSEGAKWKGGANTLKEFREKLLKDMVKLGFKEKTTLDIKQNKLDLLDEEATTVLGKEKTKEEIDRIHDLPVTEIARQLRIDLKERFGKRFKFSITSERSKIDINIMEGDIDFYTKEYRETLEKKDYDKLRLLKQRMGAGEKNVVYIEESLNILNEIENIRNLYNHDNSDAMTDYFDVNYYGGIEIGKWDKPYVNKKNKN